MKHIAYKSLAGLVTILLISITAHAQEFKTDESLGKQLKNNKVAGLQYNAVSSPAHATQAKDRNEGKESLVSQIRKGTAPNTQFAHGTSAGKVVNPATHTAKTAGSNKASLPSGGTAAKGTKAVTSKPPLQEEGAKKSTNANQ